MVTYPNPGSASLVPQCSGIATVARGTHSAMGDARPTMCNARSTMVLSTSIRVRVRVRVMVTVTVRVAVRCTISYGIVPLHYNLWSDRGNYMG